ncbi:hypothetical protein KQX54_004616 [Cotesia glomerata]|uniref:Reverse transcriptase zinc-binding domain-containing protein n=1 Tax=Cotesia glomerata TaxID=32391 RepID=A0AAV7HUQ4_COTGL|nr:hypothetical protein KQX54_004616 [Cotesia glomerata]
MINEKYQNLTQVYTSASKCPGEPHVEVYNATLSTQLVFKINQKASAAMAETRVVLAILKAIELALEMQEGTVIFSDFKNTLQSLLQFCRKKFIDSAECPCGSPEQDLIHIFFECPT